MPSHKNRKQDTQFSGQDSFLDIVSNIVGILIILVMIAGVRAQQSGGNTLESISATDSTSTAPLVANASPKYADAPLLESIEKKQAIYAEKEQSVTAITNEIADLLEKQGRTREQLYLEGLQHAELTDMITSARAELGFQAENDGIASRESVELQRQIKEQQAELGKLEKAKQWFQANRPQATRLDNIPTPMSRTVNDKEVYLRLKAGRLCIVPLEELLDQIKREVGENKNKYFKQKTQEGRLGPIDGFYCNFVTVASSAVTNSETGAEMITHIGLGFAEMEPVQEPLGEPLKQALASPNTGILKKLRYYRQDMYTATIWVYPDSFDEFLLLKQYLYAQGYRVAARPIEADQLIGVSPFGTKSSSQ